MKLHIKAIGANEVPKMDVFGKADPYLIINYSKTEKPLQSTICYKTFSPIWNEEFHISVKNDDVVHFELMDFDKMKADDVISTRDFPISSFKLGKVVDDWYDFYPAKGVPKPGKVHLVFHLAKEGDKPFVHSEPEAKSKNIYYKIKHQSFTPAQMEQLKECFEEIDEDHNGSITLEETKSFLEKIGINHVFASLAFEICNKKPTDSITFEEFGPFYKLLDDIDNDNSVVYRTLFKNIDEDNNGYLDKQEVVKLLQFFGGDDWDEDDAERFIENHDKNGDGKLSFEEVAEMIDDELAEDD